MRQCSLLNVIGGQQTQNNSQFEINTLSELMAAVKKEEPLANQVMGVLQNPEVSALLNDEKKMKTIIELYNKTSPALRARIPGYVETMKRCGYF